MATKRKKKMRHTPGPLEVLAPRQPTVAGAQFLVVTGAGHTVARVMLRREGTGDAWADAELFAAAPDMAKALLFLYEREVSVHGESPNVDFLLGIRALLQRAGTLP
jgi:hypothetical protein